MAIRKYIKMIQSFEPKIVTSTMEKWEYKLWQSKILAVWNSSNRSYKHSGAGVTRMSHTCP